MQHHNWSLGQRPASCCSVRHKSTPTFLLGQAGDHAHLADSGFQELLITSSHLPQVLNIRPSPYSRLNVSVKTLRVGGYDRNDRHFIVCDHLEV